jgi:hypothetical protein
MRKFESNAEIAVDYALTKTIETRRSPVLKIVTKARKISH